MPELVVRLVRVLLPDGQAVMVPKLVRRPPPASVRAESYQQK